MKKTINEVYVIGRLYSFDLKEATVQKTTSSVYGQTYINGTINIATDDEGLNIVPITYTFVTPTTKKGNANPTYNVLKKLISDENVKIMSKDGKDAAAIIEVKNSALAIDDRYSTQDETYKTYTNNNGGYLSFKNVSDLPADVDERSYFNADMVITNFKRVPENPEKEIKEHGIVHGAIFSYNETLLPIDFKVTSEEGMNYFEGLGITSSNIVFTKVHGTIINNRIVTEKSETSAFGKPIVTTTTKYVRDWVITSAIEPHYDFGAEGVLTAAELQTKMQDREVYLAKVKKDAEDYAASKNSNGGAVGGPTAAPVGAVQTGAFKF